MPPLDMTQYELKPNCHFVDAYDIDKARAHPKDPRDRTDAACQEIAFAYVMKKDSNNKCTHLKLNDVAGFIGRFIVMGVPVNKITDIVNSEYDNIPGNTIDAVNAVVQWMKDFDSIQPRTQKPNFQEPSNLGTDTHNCHYKLDFKVNPMGIGIFKG